MITERFRPYFEQLPVDEVESYLAVAIQVGASAIHMDPADRYLRVRFRVDNALHEVARLKHIHDDRYPHPLVGQVKARAGLNLVSRVPETGRFQLQIRDILHSFRCSTLPGIFGDRTVVKIFDLSRLNSLALMGFRDANLRRLLSLVNRESGLVLVCGTPGSGRTTLLYSLISHLLRESRSVNTLEDPVECYVDGVNQTQLVADGIDYPTALRGLMRMDPDVVMVGEIADATTAELACRAAITGRLVIAGVQASDTSGAVQRFVEFGVALPALAQAVNGIVAQTLLRKLCPECQQPKRLPPLEQVQTFESFGCAACRESGFIGHQAVHEVMEFDAGLRMRLSASIHEDDLRYLNLVQGMETMKEDAVFKAVSGLVALREAVSVSDEPLDRISSNIERALRHLKGQADLSLASAGPEPARPEGLHHAPKGLLRPMARLRATAGTGGGGPYLPSAPEKVPQPTEADLDKPPGA